jgi:hypothetical protein
VYTALSEAVTNRHLARLSSMSIDPKTDTFTQYRGRLFGIGYRGFLALVLPFDTFLDIWPLKM